MKNIYKLFLIPLVVGLIIAIIQFGLPYFFKEKKELTYKIIEPITYIDPNKIGELNIVINGNQSSTLVSNQFSIENSGQIPLKNIPVRINFAIKDTTFKIYSFSFETLPKFEFGKVTSAMDKNNLKIEFELLNPGDKVFINILTNKNAASELYSKSEGMVLNKAVLEKDKSNDKTSYILTLLASILSTIIAFFITSKSISSLKDIGRLFDQIFRAKNNSDLRIISALYGKNDKYLDITEELNQMITENKISVKITNDIAGDPINGTPKELKLIYSFGSEIKTILLGENDILEIPTNEKNAS